MALRKQNHSTFQEVDAELQNLDKTKMDSLTFANRAPNSGDNGQLWLNYTGGAGARLYFRHPLTGTWTATAA